MPASEYSGPPAASSERPLFVFIDESGNDDFSTKGTSYWVLTSMLLTDITVARDQLFELRNRLLADGHDVPYFHASEDKQFIRDEVFDVLGALSPSQCRVDSVIVEKNKAHPTVRSLDRLYLDQIELVLRHQFDVSGVDVKRFSQVQVFLDRPSQRGKQFKATVKALRRRLPKHLRGVPYELFFHPSASHLGLQMVDYFSWAIFVSHERGELRPVSKVEHIIQSQFDVFKNGTTRYY